MFKDLVLVKDKVEFILERYPETRDCDKKLWLAYLCIFCDLKDTIGYGNYLKVKEIILSPKTCSMESVRRVRQKFQENKQYVGTKRAKKLEEQEKVKEWVKS